MDGKDDNSNRAGRAQARVPAAWWVAGALGLAAVLGLVRDGLPGAGTTREVREGALSPIAARVRLPVLY